MAHKFELSAMRPGVWRLAALGICLASAAGLAAKEPAGSAAPAAVGSAEPGLVTASKAAIYPGLSAYERPITVKSPEAQRWFDQGIQLLYGFNHDEAIRSFEKAAQLDPSCAMAWWGSAYAHGLHINNPAMSEEQSRLADDTATKAVAALDDESPVEQALVRAVRAALRLACSRRPLTAR